MRSQRDSIFKMKTRNIWLLGSFALSIIFTLGVIYIPGVSKLFGLTYLNIKEFLIAFGLAFSVLPLTEIFKIFQRKITT